MGVKLGFSHSWREHWLRVFESTMLRKVFGPERDEVTGVEWRRRRGSV